MGKFFGALIFGKGPHPLLKIGVFGRQYGTLILENRQKNMKKFFAQGIFQNKGVPPMEKVEKIG